MADPGRSTAVDSLWAGPEEGTASPRQSRGEILLDWSGFLFGLLLMTADYLVVFGRIPEADRRFLSAPQSKVWILLVSAQFAFWAGVILPLRRWKAEIRQEFGSHRPQAIRLKAILAVVYFAMPAYFYVSVARNSGLRHHGLKLALVNLIGGYVAITAAAGIWNVRTVIESRFAGPGPGAEGGRTAHEWAADILQLSRALQRFIGLLGAMVGLGTLTKGAFRQAFLATHGPALQGLFPSEYVLIHGAYFSILLALLYMPTHNLLAGVANRLVESVFPILPGGLDLKQSAGWQADRKALEDLLQVGTKATDNLRAALAILAPLGTSVVALWLGTKG